MALVREDPTAEFRPIKPERWIGRRPTLSVNKISAYRSLASSSSFKPIVARVIFSIWCELRLWRLAFLIFSIFFSFSPFLLSTLKISVIYDFDKEDKTPIKNVLKSFYEPQFFLPEMAFATAE